MHSWVLSTHFFLSTVNSKKVVSMATQVGVLQLRNECEFKRYYEFTRKSIQCLQLTSIINDGKAIAEPPSWKAKIDAVREVVCASRSREEVVISIINQRVAEDEHGWGERSSGFTMSKHRQLHKQNWEYWEEWRRGFYAHFLHCYAVFCLSISFKLRSLFE